MLGERPNQRDRQRPEVQVTADQLLDVASVEGSATEAGLRNNLYVAVAYIAVWLSGNGAVAIHNLMEDAATAEISRSQVWQQLRNATVLSPTPAVPSHRSSCAEVLAEEVERLRGEVHTRAVRRLLRAGRSAGRGDLPLRRVHRLPHPARL